jgi:hypothetical protein
MATEAQINANRANAKASTGPKSPEGKEKSAGNSTKFGRTGSLQPLPRRPLARPRPVCVQEVTAAEFVRNAWCVGRCVTAEERLRPLSGAPNLLIAFKC